MIKQIDFTVSPVFALNRCTHAIYTKETNERTLNQGHVIDSVSQFTINNKHLKLAFRLISLNFGRADLFLKLPSFWLNPVKPIN